MALRRLKKQEKGETYGGQSSNISYKLKELSQVEMNKTEGEGSTGIPKGIYVYS